MNLIWLGDRLMATTIGDLFVGLAFLALSAAAGAHAWCRQVPQPILALYGAGALFLVPIGLRLVLRCRHLLLAVRVVRLRNRCLPGASPAP